MKPILTSLFFCAVTCTALADTEIVADSSTAVKAPAEVSIPENELRIRQGLVLLGSICQHMAAISDYDSAEAAVPAIMRACEELQKWTQSFNSLPPASELEIQVLEDRYLPTIRKINHIIEAQADRLGAAEYYGSRNLPAALLRITQIGHN